MPPPPCAGRYIRYWHPKFRRLGRQLGVDVPRGYWFLCNKVGGVAVQASVSHVPTKIFKGFGISIPVQASVSHVPTLPIVGDSCSDSCSVSCSDSYASLGGQAATPAASPAAPALRDQLRSSTLGDQEGASASEDPSLLGLDGVSKWFLASSFVISK